MKGNRQTVESPQLRMETFQPTKDTTFESMAVEITADSIVVLIPGKEGSVTGCTLKAKNTDNPNSLQIVVEEGSIQQSATNGKHLFMQEGVISIGSEKDFKPLGQLKGKKELKLKVRDPDELQVGKRTYRQTGTLRIRLSNAFIILKSEE